MKSNFSKRILELRNSRGLTQLAFSTVVNIPVTTLSSLETGHRKTTFDTLLKIADAFNVTTDWLLGRTNTTNTTNTITTITGENNDK